VQIKPICMPEPAGTGNRITVHIGRAGLLTYRVTLREWLDGQAVVCLAREASVHRPAPDSTTSARPTSSNVLSNAPLDLRSRARRTPSSQVRAEENLTSGPGAPKAGALAKLRYSPSREMSVVGRCGAAADGRQVRGSRSWLPLA